MKYFAVLLLASLLLLGQAPPQAPTKQTPTKQAPRPAAVKPADQDAENVCARITLDVTRVNMLFTVSDKKGRFVTDLKKDDFEIIESKKRQAIQEFTAETDLPLHLAILIDTSNRTREQSLEMAQKADAVIYAISTNITNIDTPGDKVLRRLAAETGGQAFFPFKAQDLSQSFENIANELRHQYNLLYRPDPLKTDGL